MTDRPIIFSAPMIRALLEGRKTQTRRVLKPQPVITPLASEQLEDHELRGWECVPAGDEWAVVKRISYAPGDRLWVRESLAADSSDQGARWIVYAAGRAKAQPGPIRWTWKRDVVPSIHMPRWASRLTLVVTDVRAQRVQEISEDDARAEGAMFHDGRGIGHSGWRHDFKDVYADARSSFAHLWDFINANRGYGWDANPWVAALTFTVHHQNIDRMGAI